MTFDASFLVNCTSPLFPIFITVDGHKLPMTKIGPIVPSTSSLLSLFQVVLLSFL